jgi:FkbH-like protein
VSAIIEKLKRGLARQEGSPGDLVRKLAGVAGELASAPLALRACTRVGHRARTSGFPRVENQGTLIIGDDVLLNSRWNKVSLECGPGAHLELGAGTHINFGTAISAAARVSIGANVQLGQYVLVSDTEVPGSGPEEAQPIEIGDGAWLAGRVTVLPGSRIGAGSIITAGSVVSGEIPPGVVAGGNPARVLRRIDGTAVPPAAAAPGTAATPAPETTPAPEPAWGARGLLIADFTVDDLARHLASPADGPPVLAQIAPFGQVAQSLLQGPPADAADFALVWTRPESAVPSFARLLAHEPVEPEALLADVDAFCRLLERGAAGWRTLFVPTWTLPPTRRGLGMIDARPGGATRALAAMNLRLMEQLGATSNAFVLDAQRWATVGGRGGQGARGWFVGKVAFGDAVLAEASRDVKAALRGLAGAARKLVVLDLDDTLWGGIVGDVGWQALRLGGHDPVGEALVAFQRALKDLTRRGVILAVVSKNEEATALEAMRSHPEMVLKPEDLVAWRINWQDKARNIAELVSELNLGLQSVVFIDDNPVERGRVKETLPEVLVPDWPEDKLLYPSALAQLRCFDVPAVSKEDAERTQLYASERARQGLMDQVGSLDDWLEKLDIRVTVEPLGPSNLARTTQLLNKTNQMNLATRRLTEPELTAWAAGPGRALWTVSVADRFGDAGLTGIVSVETEGGLGRVVDYVLSCRVMGRRVEETMVHLAVESARALGAGALEARLLPTKKNKPCLDFWKRSGLEVVEAELFRWAPGAAYPLPACIHLDWRREAR